MKRLLITSAIATIAIGLAACGSDNKTGSAGSAGAPTVSVANARGVGNLLVDASGKALYSPDVEAKGTIKCVDACASFWKPVTTTTTPTAGAGAPTLGTVNRPDGTKQVTADGHPLYTFVNDSAGKVTGNGFTDDFGGQHFTWHVVMSNGSTGGGSGSTPTPTTAPAGGGGYGGY
jgi:predicted lipoprotein with Yx(FWY)xxD motif